MSDPGLHLPWRPLAEVELFWTKITQQVADGKELTDGLALDAVLAFASVEGDQLTDGEALEWIKEIIGVWTKGRQ